MAKKKAAKKRRGSDFHAAADKMRTRSKRSGATVYIPPEQATIPGMTVEVVTPGGPLEYEVVAVPGKAKDGARTWAIKARLYPAYRERYLEAAALLGGPATVASTAGSHSELTRVLGVVLKLGKIGPEAVLTLDGAAGSHRLLGQIVTIISAQPSLPLGDAEAAVEAEPVGVA